MNTFYCGLIILLSINLLNCENYFVNGLKLLLAYMKEPIPEDVSK